MDRFIHSILRIDEDVYECEHPECGWVGNLFDGIMHTIKNQFNVGSNAGTKLA